MRFILKYLVAKATVLPLPPPSCRPCWRAGVLGVRACMLKMAVWCTEVAQRLRVISELACADAELASEVPFVQRV